MNLDKILMTLKHCPFLSQSMFTVKASNNGTKIESIPACLDVRHLWITKGMEEMVESTAIRPWSRKNGPLLIAALNLP